MQIENFKISIQSVKTITAWEMKPHWAEVEAQVRDGETFEVLNRGKPTARIVPAKPRAILKWDDHLATAAEGRGRTAEEVIGEGRGGRW